MLIEKREKVGDIEFYSQGIFLGGSGGAAAEPKIDLPITDRVEIIPAK